MKALSTEFAKFSLNDSDTFKCTRKIMLVFTYHNFDDLCRALVAVLHIVTAHVHDDEV